MAQNMLFWSILIRFAQSRDLKTNITISVNTKREVVEIWRPIKVFLKKFAVFLQIELTNYTKCIVIIFQKIHLTIDLIRKHLISCLSGLDILFHKNFVSLR